MTLIADNKVAFFHYILRDDDGDTIDSSPEDGYGEPSGAPPQPVPRQAFEGAEPQAGMPLVVEDDEGNHLQLWVKEVGETEVLITHDHPLAGVTLHFEVEIMDVRDATAEELAHGHAHHGDGHHHH